MQWSCDQCGTVMKLWKIKCPNCKESGLSLLHVAAVGGVIMVVALVLIRTFS